MAKKIKILWPNSTQNDNEILQEILVNLQEILNVESMCNRNRYYHSSVKW